MAPHRRHPPPPVTAHPAYLTKVQYPAARFPVRLRLVIKTFPLIAVLDDEPQMRKALGRLLKTHGFVVAEFAFAEELLATCTTRLPDCLLLDLHMPGLNGFDVLERFAAQHLPVPVVVITGHDAPGTAARVRALGASDYLLKPLDEANLLAAIGKGIETVGN